MRSFKSQWRSHWNWYRCRRAIRKYGNRHRGGTTEIAVIALSGIVCDQSIRTAGDEFNSDIIDYVRRQHNMLIGERTAKN